MIRCFNCQRKVLASSALCEYCGKNPWDMIEVESFAINKGILYKYNDMASEVTVPEGVRIIDEMAFEMMPVSSVFLPDGVTAIRKHAFYSCQKLVYVGIPASVKRIEAYAFSECPLLRTVLVPKDCKIAKTAFDEHTKVMRY